MTCNPSPLAHVSLRSNVRPLCIPLLGPPPEHPLYGKLEVPPTEPGEPPGMAERGPDGGR